jgi:hypothetical protein
LKNVNFIFLYTIDRKILKDEYKGPYGWTLTGRPIKEEENYSEIDDIFRSFGLKAESEIVMDKPEDILTNLKTRDHEPSEDLLTEDMNNDLAMKVFIEEIKFDPIYETITEGERITKAIVTIPLIETANDINIEYDEEFLKVDFEHSYNHITIKVGKGKIAIAFRKNQHKLEIAINQ